MLRLANDQLKEKLLALQHQDGAKALHEYLAAERQHFLDSLSRAADELTLRRLQGAVLVLSDLLELLKPRIP